MKSKYNLSSFTRREFCKASAIAGGGILATTLPVAASAHVGGSDTITVALVGCGGRGTGAAIQALSTEIPVQLVAMADAFQDRLDISLSSINEEFQSDKKKIKVPEKNRFVGFEGYKAAIDLADVVILTTPPGFRPLHFEYAVNAGKHIFMEKPVATDAPGVRRVLKAAQIAKEKQLNVVVGLQRHYQTSYNLVYDKLQAGAIGKITAGQVYWNSAGVWVKERQPGQSELEYQMRNWYYYVWLCGDHILEQHIHNIDVANWFIGEYPVSAQGMGGREVRKGPEHGEIFDHHFVEFVYPGGAVIASQCRHQPNTMNRVTEIFQGTKGTIDMTTNTVASWDGEEILKHNARKDANPYQVEHDKLFASIRDGGVINDADNGAYATLTAILGRMATYSGQLISWDEALKSEMSLVPENLTWDSEPPVKPDANGLYPIPVPGKTKVL
ncbi:MAG: dehydrogenase [Cyclobacteriaceae bacterium]|nr:MAG: dehydrogenase [Cyclobacteriaceae bacterium]